MLMNNIYDTFKMAAMLGFSLIVNVVIIGIFLVLPVYFLLQIPVDNI